MQEIKYYDELHSDTPKGEHDRAQTEKQKAWCQQNEIAYMIRTDRVIAPGDFTIRNLEWMAAKARRCCQTNDIARKIILTYLRGNGKMMIGQLYTSGNLTKESGLDLLADLFYKGDISFVNFDSEQISNRTEVIANGI